MKQSSARPALSAFALAMAASFLALSCGHEDDDGFPGQMDAGESQSSDGGDVSDAGGNGSSALDGAGPEDIVLYASISGGHLGADQVYLLNGRFTWLALMGDCGYRAFSTFGNRNGVPNYWADVVQGSLSREDCEDLVASMSIWQECAIYQNASVYDASTLFVSSGGESLVCYHRCEDSGGDARAIAVETAARAAMERLASEGTPMEDLPLRGVLIRFQEVVEDFWQDAVDLPEGMESLAVDSSLHTSDVRQDILPDAYQAVAAELRRKVQSGVQKTLNNGIPLKDAEGRPYLLYLRQVTDIEDRATGEIPLADGCRRQGTIDG